MSFIVFDIGGSHARVARADGSALGEMRKINTPAQPDAAVSEIGKLIEEAANGSSIEVISGAVAGVIDADGVVISSPNLPKWDGFPLAGTLSSRFNARVLLGNDAELEGFGEALYGAGKGANIIAYITVGTGVGGARIVNGAIDSHAVGFEPGHQIIDVARGVTLESLIGGAALERKYGTHPDKLPRSVWDELTPILAAGIWNAIVHWSPDVVVLNGSLINEETAFRLSEVTLAVEKYRKVIPSIPPIRKAVLGDTAGLYGALAILNEQKTDIK